ncbi:unnamed protein product, partial [Phaeothamnion confervicola]
MDKDSKLIKSAAAKEEKAWGGLMEAIKAGASSSSDSKFDVVVSNADANFASKTVGLVTAAEFRRIR